jgi:hypothetical protein
MSRPSIQNIKLNEHLHLSECHPDSESRTNNWWLYDKRAYGTGMNIAMRVKTREEAFVEAIEFWAKKALKAESSYNDLKSKVDLFVGHFIEPEDD